MSLFVTPSHHYHQNSSKWPKHQPMFLLTRNVIVAAAKKVIPALCVIMTLTSMTLNLLTKNSKDLFCSHLCLFVFDELNQRGHRVSFFCFKYKNYKYLHQFLKVFKSTYYTNTRNEIREPKNIYFDTKYCSVKQFGKAFDELVLHLLPPIWILPTRIPK